MPAYYLLSSPDIVRDIPPATLAAWQASGNIKAALWAPQPQAPSPEFVWQGGQWVTPPPPPPAPDWIGFVNALGAVQAVDDVLTAALQTSKVLHGQFIGGLVQAADGSYAGFLNAWQKGISAGLIQPALAAQIQEAAASFNLPSAFVSGLQSPGLPPIQPGGVQSLGGLGTSVLITNPLPPEG